jgi:hypothetical protein
MNNAQTTAFPFVAGDQSNPDDRAICEGMNKREYFAGVALQGITGILWDRKIQSEFFVGGSDMYVVLAATAVKIADALLLELSKPTGG